jgi:hypothetical protein
MSSNILHAVYHAISADMTQDRISAGDKKCEHRGVSRFNLQQRSVVTAWTDLMWPRAQITASD